MLVTTTYTSKEENPGTCLEALFGTDTSTEIRRHLGMGQNPEPNTT